MSKFVNLAFIISKLGKKTKNLHKSVLCEKQLKSNILFFFKRQCILILFCFRLLDLRIAIHISDFRFYFRFLCDDHLQVVLTHQFLVRPTNGPTGDKEQNNKKDRTNTTDTATSTTSTNSDTSQQSTPEFSFAETVLQKVGKPLKDVIEQVR